MRKVRNFVLLITNNKTMQANNTQNQQRDSSAQTESFLVTTYQKVEVPAEPILETPHGTIHLTSAEQSRIKSDLFEVFAITDERFPDPDKAVKEAIEYNLRISILEIASQIGCIDAATDFLNDYANGLSELKYYHKALADIYYSTSKQAA